ncbi:site-specific integrase [Croceitalea sp. MTPC5]|uniref:Phage integrase SAM-like domain-containing protein n=1 Tax=Croceitalea marina TaxID=1775166 RepID=A0ABW5MVN9_9FLAO|nr:site-specific integrase [Croceitalea sp. MTPC5]
MQVSFHLRQDKIKKSGLVPIRMLISANGFKYFKVIKGIDCIKPHWDDSNQRIKTPRKNEAYNYHLEYNKIIDESENRAKTLFRYILLNNINPTKDFIVEKMSKGLEPIKLTNDFFPSFDEFIEKGKNVKATSTLKKYQSVLNFYKEFSENTNFPLTFETINIQFFERFRDYCFEEKNTLNNYFAKLISILKTFMNWSFERGYHENVEYRKFKASEEEIEVIYLTMDELMALYKHDFHNDRLKQVRDVYCFGCFTGLRYSDLSQLRSSNILDDYLVLNIKKTKTISHKIPLNNFAKEILARYEDTIHEPLPIISDVKFNKYIKECCRFAKITTPTSISRWVGQKRIDLTEPKWKFITSHTARKTFVTNSLVLGMKEMVVRNITGHKKEASFRRYVKIAEDLKKQEMDSTWNSI